MRITIHECTGKEKSLYDNCNVAFYCENCGTEQASLFETYNRKGMNIQSFYRSFLTSDHQCPVCGKIFAKEPGYYLPAASYFVGSDELFTEFYGSEPLKRDAYTRVLPGENQLSSVEDKFARITQIREKREKRSMWDAVELFAQAHDFTTALDKPKGNTAAIKTDIEKLKEYIRCIIDLEITIYSLKHRLADLYFERMQNERYAVRCGCEKIVPAKELIQRRKQQVDSSIEKLEKIKKEGVKIHFITVPSPKKPQKPTLITPGIFNRKKVLAENEALTAQYNAAMEEYRVQVANCAAEKERLTQEAWKDQHMKVAKAENDVEAAKQALAEAEAAAAQQIEEAKTLPSLATAIKEVLSKEILEAEALLSKLLAARNELYAYDIIFGKYRDVVALSSFYEYLMAGRCTALEGADGAYNIYEGEIRANRIIAQLDTVISTLEDIKQNQYLMYQELRNINATLTVLNSTMSKALTSIRNIEANTASMNGYMEHISKNSDVIAHNTAATAYYSKVNLELTNALGFMVALK